MCLNAVEGLPLRVFGFKYDSKQGRRQVGVVGPELKQVMPDSVKIVPVQPFPNPLKTGPKIIKVKNYHHVDHNVLFMHGLGATQELARLHHQQAALVAALQNETDILVVRDTRRAQEYAERAGKLAAFSEDGELGAEHGIGARNGTLYAPRIGAFELQGDVQCSNRTLADARLRGGRAEALEQLSTTGEARVGGALHVGDHVHVAGPLTALGMVSGAGPYHDLSDRRLKQRIRQLPAANAAATVRRLRGVTYRWTGPGAGAGGVGVNAGRAGRDEVGFIAQEVERVVPSAVQTRADGYKAVATSRLVPHLVEGFKHLAAALDESQRDSAAAQARLEARLASLERENNDMRQHMEQQRAALDHALFLLGRAERGTSTAS